MAPTTAAPYRRALPGVSGGCEAFSVRPYEELPPPAGAAASTAAAASSSAATAAAVVRRTGRRRGLVVRLFGGRGLEELPQEQGHDAVAVLVVRDAAGDGRELRVVLQGQGLALGRQLGDDALDLAGLDLGVGGHGQLAHLDVVPLHQAVEVHEVV